MSSPCIIELHKVGCLPFILCCRCLVCIVWPDADACGRRRWPRWHVVFSAKELSAALRSRRSFGGHRNPCKHVSCCAADLRHICGIVPVNSVVRHPARNTHVRLYPHLGIRQYRIGLDEIASLQATLSVDTIGAACHVRPPPCQPPPSPPPQTKVSTHPCALVAVPQIHGKRQATACPRAARKTATCRSLRLPTGSIGVIG